jgi:2-iminobutanoate/2-iminopropanoate deaminase
MSRDPLFAMKEVIRKFDQSPPCCGPYSLAVKTTGKLLFVAGQGPWDPWTQKRERGSIAEQTRLTLECIKRIVEAAGGRMEDAVSCRVYLQTLNEQTFAEMNGVYEKYWGADKPARTTVGAQMLGIDVEIDCVVALP